MISLSLHERALTITYEDNISSSQNLFKKDNYLLIHERNFQLPKTEMFKVYNKMTPEILNNNFKLCNKNWRIITVL